MRIKSLTLKNMRMFGDESQTVVFDPNKNVTILLGNNGCGKSTILDAASILLSTFVGTFPGNTSQNFKDKDVHIQRNNKVASYLHVSMELMQNNDNVYTVSRSRKGWDKGPLPEVKEIKSYAESLKEQILKNEEKVNIPVLAYYGTGRGQIKAPERKRGFQKVFAQWDCYNNSLDASTDFKRFFAWYDMMEDEERREREHRRDFSYHSTVLTSVRRAIEAFVGPHYTNPHIAIHPLRFVLEEEGKYIKRELRLEQFSDGYKIIIAMVADIASRMAEGNPGMDNPLDGSGIILIDEIDLHLHPKWQRVILDKLNKVFPNVQFIVTTHSPIVLLGAVDFAQIITLEEGIVNVRHSDYSHYDVGQILLSDLFGLQNLQSPSYDVEIEEQKKLLERYDILSEAEKKRLDELDAKLRVLSSSSTLEDMKLREYIYKVADQLKIETR